METKNYFSKIDSFCDITTDRNSMATFLAIAKNKVRDFEQLSKDTGLSLKDILDSVDKLEKGDFITRNPNPLSQKFRLGFNGQLFAEQLKTSYSEIKEYLGSDSLIEPLEE